LLAVFVDCNIVSLKKTKGVCPAARRLEKNPVTGLHISHVACIYTETHIYHSSIAVIWLSCLVWPTVFNQNSSPLGELLHNKLLTNVEGAALLEVWRFILCVKC